MFPKIAKRFTDSVEINKIMNVIGKIQYRRISAAILGEYDLIIGIAKTLRIIYNTMKIKILDDSDLHNYLKKTKS